MRNWTGNPEMLGDPIADNLFLLCLTPSPEILYLAKCTEWPTLNFDLDNMIQASWNLWRTWRILLLSMSFLMPLMPWIALSDLWHHFSDEAHEPMGQDKFKKWPCGIKKVIKKDEASSSQIWKKTMMASNLAKNFASLSKLDMMLEADGKGCISLLINIFSFKRLITNWMPFPSGFATQKPGAIHSVGSSINLFLQ